FKAGAPAAAPAQPAATSAPKAAQPAPAATPAAPKPQPVAPYVSTGSESELETREKMTPMRKAIAKALFVSQQRSPHVTSFDEVEVSKLMAHRKKYK
ncbi:dienelactone hydrolase, partial [Staphylococcus aureus]